MIEALEFEVAVQCSNDHAFDVWANRTSMWWPRDHTRSGDPSAVVTFEPRVGGRVFERTPDGTEHDWGEVTVWEPPHRLVYLWHIYGDRSEATLVEITFTAASERTTVKVKHTGWDRLGEKAEHLRGRNQTNWSDLMKAYVPATSA
jgi:uncharacterized protein YndB with AHSA1/START domain